MPRGKDASRFTKTLMRYLATNYNAIPVRCPKTLRRQSGLVRSQESPQQPALSPRSKHPQFTLYRCTGFVAYTASSVFAVGYAFSALLAPLRIADSRVPKPLHKTDRG